MSTHQPLYKQKLGNTGETIATQYLQKQGYRIIERNFRARYGELDIICIDRDTLVFVEVKTRIDEEFGLPEEAVTPKKLREIIKTGEYYVHTHQGLPQQLRIDVIGIIMNEEGNVSYFNHISNVSQ